MKEIKKIKDFDKMMIKLKTETTLKSAKTFMMVHWKEKKVRIPLDVKRT